jgi:hypothetical protein
MGIGEFVQVVGVSIAAYDLPKQLQAARKVDARFFGELSPDEATKELVQVCAVLDDPLREPTVT